MTKFNELRAKLLQKFFYCNSQLTLIERISELNMLFSVFCSVAVLLEISNDKNL